MSNFNKIVVAKAQEITLSTHSLEFQAPNRKILIDIKKLLLGENDEAYFNATQIAKIFEYKNERNNLVDGSQILKNYLTLDRTKEYMSTIKDLFNIYSKEDIPLKSTKRGYIQENSKLNGTWFHILLLENFLEFILSVKDFLYLKFTGQLNFTTKKKKEKNIYILLANDDSIKIGISENPEKRIREIENASGKKIIKAIITKKLVNAYQIEQFLLNYFYKNRVNGEWLENIPFEIIVLKLQEILGEYQENSDFQTLISYEEKPKESKFKELILLMKKSIINIGATYKDIVKNEKFWKYILCLSNININLDNFKFKNGNIKYSKLIPLFPNLIKYTKSGIKVNFKLINVDILKSFTYRKKSYEISFSPAN